MTFVNLLKRKRDRVGLEPVFDFQWHPLKIKHILFVTLSPHGMFSLEKFTNSQWHNSYNKQRKTSLV